MKILYVIHQFYPDHYTGTEKIFLNLATMMQKFGHKVEVMTYSFNDDSFYERRKDKIIFKKFIYKGIPVFALRHKMIPKDVHHSLENKDLRRVASDLISSRKPDVVHIAHSMRVSELVKVLRPLKIPYIVTLTDFFLICPKYTLITSQNTLCTGPEAGRACRKLCSELPADFLTQRLNIAKGILLNANAVVSPSQFLARIFEQEIPDLDIKIIKHGLRYSLLKQNVKRYTKGDKVVFCYAGSLTPHKGVENLIDAFKKTASDRAVLKIYGSGTQENHLKAIAGDDRRIHFSGVYSDHQIGEIMQSVDVLIIPSLWYETFCLIMHEAFACGVPVVASNIGVMAGKIQNGVNGFLFKMGDSGQLKDIIENIINNPALLSDLKYNIRSMMIGSTEQEAYAYDRLYVQSKKTNGHLKGRNDRTVLRSYERKRKTKVLYVVHTFLPESVGGLELHLYRLAKEVGKTNHVKIFCSTNNFDKEDYTTEDLVYDGIEIRKMNNTPRDFSDFRMLYTNKKVDTEFEKFLASYKPDIVDVHHLNGLSTTLLESIKRRGIPLVFTLHDYWMMCPKGQRIKDDDLSLCEELDRRRCAKCLEPTLSVGSKRNGNSLRYDFSADSYQYKEELSYYDEHMRKMLTLPDTIITPTEFLKMQFVRYGVKPGKIQVIGHGLDTELFSNINRTPAKKIRFGFIGSVIPTKGVHVLVEAFNRFTRDDVSLSIFGEILPFHGDTGYGERLKQIIRLGKDVIFYGRYDNKNIARILSEIDVLVVPSIWHETFSIVIREGFLAGIPVIASNIGAMKESIEDGETGLLFECGDPDDLYAKMKMIVQDEELRRRLSNCRDKVKEMTQNAKEVMQIYRELVEVSLEYTHTLR